MSFAFGFGGDDIESDDDHDHEDLAQQVETFTINEPPLIPPKKHTLQELLSSLPSQVSYNLLSVNRQQVDGQAEAPPVSLPRRSVFDIRAQLMVEANPEENDNEDLLTSLESGDLTSGVYEGGFKTWECSLDIASLVANIDIHSLTHVIELGAGSAVPSLVALATALRGDLQHPLRFTLCDYNEDVLRLVTAPNVFLCSDAINQQQQEDNQQEDLEVEDIDEEKVQRSIQHFRDRNLLFDFVSGAWGDEFLRLINTSDLNTPNGSQSTLILASETIYSPKSTETFVNTLMQLLRMDAVNTKAWVAAKKVYFGVGGSVDDFVDQVKAQGGSVKTLLDVKGVGVGRVVLEIVAEV